MTGCKTQAQHRSSEGTTCQPNGSTNRLIENSVAPTTSFCHCPAHLCRYCWKVFVMIAGTTKVGQGAGQNSSFHQTYTAYHYKCRSERQLRSCCRFATAGSCLRPLAATGRASGRPKHSMLLPARGYKSQAFKRCG